MVPPGIGMACEVAGDAVFVLAEGPRSIVIASAAGEVKHRVKLFKLLPTITDSDGIAGVILAIVCYRLFRITTIIVFVVYISFAIFIKNSCLKYGPALTGLASFFKGIMTVFIYINTF